MVQTVQKTVEVSDHRDFTGGRCPCCVGRAGSTVASRGGDSRDPTAADRRKNRAVPHFMAVVAVEKCFSPVLRAFFALRPLGRRVPALPRLF